MGQGTGEVTEGERRIKVKDVASQGGSLIEVRQMEDCNGSWMQISWVLSDNSFCFVWAGMFSGVQDGPNLGECGWVRCKRKDKALVDFREQCQRMQKEDLMPMTPPPTGSRIVKSPDALAACEIPDPEAEPADELDTPGDLQASNQPLSCGYCVCQIVPPERTCFTLLCNFLFNDSRAGFAVELVTFPLWLSRTHPATVVHHSAFELPASPSKRLEVLSPTELQQWLQGIYSRYNPSLLPKATDLVCFMAFVIVWCSDCAARHACRCRTSWKIIPARKLLLSKAYAVNTEFHRQEDGTGPAEECVTRWLSLALALRKEGSCSTILMWLFQIVPRNNYIDICIYTLWIFNHVVHLVWLVWTWWAALLMQFTLRLREPSRRGRCGCVSFHSLCGC